MATTHTQIIHTLGPVVDTWTLNNADNGAASAIMGRSDCTVTATGTFGGATITIQGSNDNTNWFSTTDYLGAAVTFAAAGMKTLMNSPLYLRAISSGGAGTDVVVINVAKPIGW